MNEKVSNNQSYREDNSGGSYLEKCCPSAFGSYYSEADVVIVGGLHVIVERVKGV